MRRMLMLVLAMALVGCEGGEGPTGPSGQDGDRGEPGPGTRVVYAGHATVRQIDVRVPAGLGLDNPPVFACYRRDGDALVSMSACAMTLEAASGDPIVRATHSDADWQYRIVVVY